MSDKVDKFFTLVLMIGFGVGLVFGVYQWIDVLLSPSTQVGLFDNYPKVDIITIILNFYYFEYSLSDCVNFPSR